MSRFSRASTLLSWVDQVSSVPPYPTPYLLKFFGCLYELIPFWILGHRRLLVRPVTPLISCSSHWLNISHF
ncbi:hypothetical protein DFH07DRAFT_827381 [Mycena maculata]|uniref:Uncharacterized protein n=1 Tax=Mycena maculata TaxID=230809 RepID=A0AAD7N801_9AGAR|nr:hypothetical protein DFH07DRAFT_827381 [Mycena maculata]